MGFVEHIVTNFARWGSRPALYEVRGGASVPVSGESLFDRVARTQGYLAAKGIAKGDRVALLAPNSADWVATDLGILSHGAISVPLYARQEPRELAAMLEDCQPRLVIVADAALADALAAHWTSACPVALMRDVVSHAPLTGGAEPVEVAEVVTFIYTSGTSGEAKGVMLTRGNVDFMLEQTRTRLEQLWGNRADEERVFHYLPFCFAGARIMLWTQLLRGNSLRLSTDLGQLVGEVKTADPHYFLNVPAVLERIRGGVLQRIQETGGGAQRIFQAALAADSRLRAGTGGIRDRLKLTLARKLVFPRIRRGLGASLEFLICGSALLGEETQAFFQMLGIPVYQVYGLTETTAIVSIDRPEAVRAGYVGYPLSGCEVSVSGEGELLCRGPNIFAGYWQKPEATAAVLQEGWFHTGDQVERDPTGNLKIVGRLKDLVIPESGHNVAPAKLEQRLLEACPAIQQAVVLGHGRPYLTAIVTGEVDETALERALEQVNAELPHYMRVRKAYRAPEPFDEASGLLTANQKLRRRAIEARYQAAIDGLYA